MSKINLGILANYWFEQGVFEEKAKDYDKDLKVLAKAWIEYNKVAWSMVGKYGEEIHDFMDDQVSELTREEIDRISEKAYNELGFDIIR